MTANRLQYSQNGCVRLARTALVSLGSEKRGVHDEGWRDDQTTGDRHALAFSLLPIEATFDGEETLTLSPATMAMTQPLWPYRRAPLSDRGQRTIFIATDTRTTRENVRLFDEKDADRTDPYPARSGPSSLTAITAIRQLERLVFDANVDVEPMLVDELAMLVIYDSLEYFYRNRGRRPPECGTRALKAQRECVNHALVQMCLAPDKKWTLGEIASDVSMSAAYLSRIFRKHTGSTLFECLKLIRIVRALEQLPDRRGDLTSLALDCGFSSHAHMTSTFSETLGIVPRTLAGTSAVKIRDSIAKLKQRLSPIESRGSLRDPLG